MTSIEDLARLYEGQGPFVSLYLDTTSRVENAQQRLALRWKGHRRSLSRAGADGPTLDAVDAEVSAGHTPGDGRVVIVAGGAALHVSNQSEPPSKDLARWSPLPSVGPLIAWRQSTTAHVVVLTDRTGADIVALAGDDGCFAVTVQGETGHLTRSAPGGWSQPRFQQRAENRWEENSALVAATLCGVVDDVHPNLVVAAGDVRAVQFLRASLPKRVLDRLRVVEGCRADGTDGPVAERVAALVHAAAAAETEATLDRFRQSRGLGDAAADGPGATIRALARGQVATLLVHDDPDDGRRAWFGPDPVQLATTGRSLRATGVRAPRKARLIDVLLRAALGTGAEVRLLPGPGPDGPRGGIGALLRYR